MIRCFRVTSCSLWLLAVVFAAALTSGSTGRAEDVQIRIQPNRVFPRIVYKLRVDVDRETPGVYWSWSATAGELLSDGEREVFWSSPPLPGKAVIGVVGLGADDSGVASALRGRIEVSVQRPSKEAMVFVPAGTSLIGDAWTDIKDRTWAPTVQNITDKPARSVYLDSFWIDRNKVTNEQFCDFLNEFLSQGLTRVVDGAAVGLYEGVEVPFYYFRIEKFASEGPTPKLRNAIRWDGKRFSLRDGMEKHPVMDVTWSGAVTYAFYHGKRLPTDSEWEKAGRGTDGRHYPWGNEVPTPYHANVNAYFGDAFVPVGSFSPTGDSPYGVADVLGGFEWVDDWFDSHYFRDTASEVPFDNPKGSMWGSDHLIRGAAVYHEFYGDAFNLEPLTFRYQWVFDFEHGHLFGHKDTGFRTALSPFSDELPPGTQRTVTK